MTAWKLENSFDYKGRTVQWDSRGEGHPMVLVHGTPWSSFNLRHLIEGLADEFEVFYYDFPGYGQSDKSDDDVSLGIQNEVLAALLDHWSIDQPIAIGHDFGGATVLRTHLLNKKAYEKLILIDPVAVSPWGSSFFKHVNKYEEAFAGVPDYIHEAIVEAYVKTAAYQPLSQDTLEGILKPWLTPAGKAAFYRQIAQADSKFTDEVQPLYPTIQMPTLILWGEQDEWIPLEKGQQLQKLIPNSTLKTIAESGHLVIEEEPAKLVQKIKAFVK